MVEDLARELAGVPAVRMGWATWTPGDRGHEVLERARESLRSAPTGLAASNGEGPRPAAAAC